MIVQKIRVNDDDDGIFHDDNNDDGNFCDDNNDDDDYITVMMEIMRLKWVM